MSAAEAFAKFVSFAAENPGTAITGGIIGEHRKGGDRRYGVSRNGGVEDGRRRWSKDDGGMALSTLSSRCDDRHYDPRRDVAHRLVMNQSKGAET